MKSESDIFIDDAQVLLNELSKKPTQGVHSYASQRNTRAFTKFN